MKKTHLYIIFFLFSILYAEETIELPDITATFEKSVAENKILLEKEDIEKLNVQNLTDLISTTGIQLLEYGAYGLESKPSIRGFTDETVRVIIDGICVNNAQYGTFDFTSLDIKDIERIEIIKGGYTEGVSDEGAVGGAIYITTKKQTPGHHFSADVSTKTYFNYKKPFDTFNASLGYDGQLSQNSFLKTHIKGTFANNQYFYKNYKNQTVEQEHSSVLDGNSDIKFTHFFKDGSSFSAGDLFYAGNKTTPGSKTSFTYGNQKDFNNKLILNLINPSIANLFTLENNLAYLKDVRFYTSDSENSSHYIDTIKYSAQADFFKRNLNKTVSFQESAGFSADYVYLNSTNDGNHNQISAAFKETTKFFIGNHFNIGIPMTFKLCNSNFDFSPKLGLSFTFKQYALTFDIYKMVQFPNMDDLYWIGESSKGNPDLLPEKGYGADLSFVSDNKIFPFTITVFSNYYEQKIQWAEGENNIWQPQNIASAFYAGVDFDFSKGFFNDFLVISGNGEYLYTRLLDKSNTVTYGKRIMWTPDFTGNLNAAFNFTSASLRTQISYMGKRYKGNNNAGYLKPYFLINLSGEYRFKNNLTVYSRIDNLLNWDYEAVDNYSMPGISLTLGLKVAAQ